MPTREHITRSPARSTRASHSFPLPHLAPPTPLRRSLKPRYTPWPVIPDTDEMEYQWSGWYTPYIQQLGVYGWVCDATRGWFLARVGLAPPPKYEQQEDWKNRGIDPRLIYRSPSPETDTTSSSSSPSLSSLLDSPSSVTSASSLPPTFSDIATSDEEDAVPFSEQLHDQLAACFTQEREPAAEPQSPLYSGGKRKRQEEAEISHVTPRSHCGDEGDDEQEPSSGDDCSSSEDTSSDYEETKRKRQRVSTTPAKRQLHRRPDPPRERNTRPPRPVVRRAKRTEPTTARAAQASPKLTRTAQASPKLTPAHELTKVVFACPYHLASAPHLTCGAFFSSESEVRRHAATHLAKEFYEYEDSSREGETFLFGGMEPTFIHCPHEWCERPFVRKDALVRHMAGPCLKTSDRSAQGKQARLDEARKQVMRREEYWVETPVRMPHRVEAVTAKVEGQQKRVITRIVRVLSTYGETYDVKRVKDGEEMEVWWAPKEGKEGRHRVFQPAKA